MAVRRLSSGPPARHGDTGSRRARSPESAVAPQSVVRRRQSCPRPSPRSPRAGSVRPSGSDGAKRAASSRDSLVAPSADTPVSRQERRALARAKTKELLEKDGKRRKAGGQLGRRGSGRGLLGEDQMSEIVDHYPGECSGCGREFSEVEKVPRWGAGRHQVAELPAIAVEYVEYRTQVLRCPGCKTWTRGTLGVL